MKHLKKFKIFEAKKSKRGGFDYLNFHSLVDYEELLYSIMEGEIGNDGIFTEDEFIDWVDTKNSDGPSCCNNLEDVRKLAEIYLSDLNAMELPFHGVSEEQLYDIEDSLSQIVDK